MNKKLKIATIAVSAVMAGSMVVGLFGCTKPNSGNNNGDVTLNINIGDASQRSISFAYGELLSGTIKLPDGKTYSSSSLKPAWAAFEEMVGCKFNDVWQNASKKLELASTSNASGSRLSDMDIITDGAANVSTYSNKLLDLNPHLDKMPNYKKFLDENPIIRLSLTSNTNTGAMYYAPYFDGNNDIEKYELFKVNWVQTLLDDATAGDTTTTYKSHGAAKAGKKGEFANTVSESTAIEAFMGSTDWTVDVLDKDGEKVANGLKVSYSKALAAAKSAEGLGKAYQDAVGAAYAGTSGNIVDIMNAAINAKKGDITGDALRNILKEYIKVAYRTADDKSFYDREGYKLSDVFVGYSAGWDVDLYAALGRVLVTNPSLLKSGNKGNTIGGEGATSLDNLWLLSARQNNMQRMIDTVSMIGQLYGVRGLESKNLYTYIDSEGNVKDPRNDPASYEAMNKFSAFWKEGLVYTGSDGKDGNQSYYKSGTPEALSTYDYVNTQTPAGFQLEGVVSGKYTIEEGYNYTPVITPVSKWNDGTEKYMRFTESWRTTKDTGFCIPKANVENNQAKLNAVLKFIDCMFSNDGQILLTYGPKASSATAGDGFWYNEEATAEQIAAGQYFEYEGKKLYSTVEYGGVYQPHITENVMKAYYAQQTNEGIKFDGTGVTYAGEQLPKPNTETDIVKKGGAFKTDVYVIKGDGTYSMLNSGAKAAADCYTVEKDGKHYVVDKNGWPLGKDSVKLPMASANQWAVNSTLNYTNFARYVIGSALPIGNKLQSFEFQLTSDMGRTGALVVDKAMKEGVVLHTQNIMTENPWYTVVPTVLPYSTADNEVIKTDHAKIHTGDKGNPFSNNKENNSNVYWEIIKNGYSGDAITNLKAGLSFTAGSTVTAKEIITACNTEFGLVRYIAIKNDTWQKSKTYYATLAK